MQKIFFILLIAWFIACQESPKGVSDEEKARLELHKKYVQLLGADTLPKLELVFNDSDNTFKKEIQQFIEEKAPRGGWTGAITAVWSYVAAVQNFVPIHTEITIPTGAISCGLYAHFSIDIMANGIGLCLYGYEGCVTDNTYYSLLQLPNMIEETFDEWYTKQQGTALRMMIPLYGNYKIPSYYLKMCIQQILTGYLQFIHTKVPNNQTFATLDSIQIDSLKYLYPLLLNLQTVPYPPPPNHQVWKHDKY